MISSLHYVMHIITVCSIIVLRIQQNIDFSCMFVRLNKLKTCKKIRLLSIMLRIPKKCIYSNKEPLTLTQLKTYLSYMVTRLIRIQTTSNLFYQANSKR